MSIHKSWLALAAVALSTVASAQISLPQRPPGQTAPPVQTQPPPTNTTPTTPFFSTPTSPASGLGSTSNPSPSPLGASSTVSGIPPLIGTQQASTRFAPPLPDAQVTETSLSEVPVFGQGLFQGRFSTESFTGFNPDYLLSVGDQVDIKLWGAIDTQLVVPVDAQGNVFIPRVGPVRVINVRNSELNDVVKRQIRTVYREDVGVYATLAAAVPVKVFVSGFVTKPGLYPGYASDSLLNFLDRAGGISAVSGSYIDVRVLRGGQPIAQVDLYDFLTKGSLEQVQLRDGDSIFVGPIGLTALVEGLVASPAQFEFRKGARIADLLGIAGVSGRATNVSITRSQGSKREVIYVAVGDPALDGPVMTGDLIEVVADRLVGQIAVSLEGEHEGAGQYVLPYAATMADLLAQVKYSAQSQKDGLQLYRRSVAERQRQVLGDMLGKLEQSALSARSLTDEEASLRTKEAQLILQFVERAKKIVPRGQVVLPRDLDPTRIALEDGDVVRIPRTSQLVQVHGEVFLPNAFVWRKGYYVDDYLNQAGGLIQKSSGDRVLLLRQSGEIASENGGGFVLSTTVEPGDEILVLPAVDTKHFQFGKEVIQVLYQIAVAAGVVARL